MRVVDEYIALRLLDLEWESELLDERLFDLATGRLGAWLAAEDHDRNFHICVVNVE